jgi:hypothetical protein
MRFLEEPIRFRPNPSRRSTLRLAAVCVCLPLIAALALGQWHARLKSDYTINPFALHMDSLLDCDSPAPLGKKPAGCTWPAAGSRGRAVLVGDSLAGQYSEAFVQGMAAAGIDAEIATLSACPFMEFRGNADQAHDLGFTPDRECASFVRRSMAQLLADPPDIVFISSSAQRFLPAPAAVAPSAASDSRALADQQWTQARATMIRRLQAAGSSIVMIDPLTNFDGWGPLTEGPFKESPAITVLLGGSRYNPQVPRSLAKTSLSRAVAAEDAAVAETGADHLQFFDVVCPSPSPTCSAKNGAAWTYRDFEHLSVATARELSSAFKDMAERVLTSRVRN